MAKPSTTEAPSSDALETKLARDGINLRKMIAMGNERPTSTMSGGQGARSAKAT